MNVADKTRKTAAGTPRLSRLSAVVTGVLAVATAVTVGHLVAGLLNPNASPIIAVGNSVRDLTPPAITEWAIANLGDAKKVLGFVGVGVALLVMVRSPG